MACTKKQCGKAAKKQAGGRLKRVTGTIGVTIQTHNNKIKKRNGQKK